MWSPQKKKSPLKKSKPFSELDVKKPALSQAFLWVSSLVFFSILNYLLLSLFITTFEIVV